MAISGVAPARNRIDDIVNDVTMDNWEKKEALDRVKRYLSNKQKDIDALIAASPASPVNVPKAYLLYVDGKPFAKFEDGAIVPL
jgi:hypothetical protein